MKKNPGVWYSVEILPWQSSQFNVEKPSYGEFIAVKNFSIEPRSEARTYANDLVHIVRDSARVFICTWSSNQKRFGVFSRYEEVKS